MLLSEQIGFWFGRETMNFIVLLSIILRNVIYGLSVYFIGSLVNSADVLDVLALRFLMAFVAFFVLKQLKVLDIHVGVKDIFRKTERTPYIKSLLLAGLFEPVLYMFFETTGISMTTDITAAVILALSPAFSCIFETIILKEKSSFLHQIFLGIGMVGVIYIAFNTNTNDGRNTAAGIICMFLAVISGVLFSAFSRKSSRHFKTFEVTYITCMLGAVVFNGINVARHLLRGDILHYFDPYFSLSNLIGFAYLAILSTIVATAMNNYALSKVHVSTNSAFVGVSTLITVAAGVLLGGETLYTFQIIGLTLIVIRMVGVSYLDIKKAKQLQK